MSAKASTTVSRISSSINSLSSSWASTTFFRSLQSTTYIRPFAPWYIWRHKERTLSWPPKTHSNNGLQTAFNRKRLVTTSPRLRENSPRASTSRSCHETISPYAANEMRIRHPSPREYTHAFQECVILSDRKCPYWDVFDRLVKDQRETIAIGDASGE